MYIYIYILLELFPHPLGAIEMIKQWIDFLGQIAEEIKSED